MLVQIDIMIPKQFVFDLDKKLVFIDSNYYKFNLNMKIL